METPATIPMTIPAMAPPDSEELEVLEPLAAAEDELGETCEGVTVTTAAELEGSSVESVEEPFFVTS